MEPITDMLFILSCFRLFAQKHNFISYNIDEGLPQSEVFSILQDNDRHIWLATGGGVSRFDGKIFSNYTTDEGLSENGDHPVQQAWNEVDVPQCGYCQAGQIMTASALLAKNPHPTVEQVETAMNGNLCRCGTYHRIREAVVLASTKMK